MINNPFPEHTIQQYLKHGSDTSTTSNHTNCSTHVGCVVKVTLRTTNSHLITNLEFTEQSGDVTRRIRLSCAISRSPLYIHISFHYLDKQIEMAKIIIRASRGVTARDLFTIDLCHDRNMLTNRKA